MITGKLLIVALLAVTFVTISEARYGFYTFSDSNCATLVGFAAGTGSCSGVNTKRSIEGYICHELAANGPWYQARECMDDNNPLYSKVPEGFQSLNTSFTDNCDVSNGFDITATSSSATTTIVVYNGMLGGVVPFNATISCDNGVITYENCAAAVGCTTFSATYETCSVATSAPQGVTISGIQNSCVPPPQAPMAPVAPPMTPPMAEPMASTPVAPVAAPVAPVAAPKAATPVKKTSSGVSLAVGSALAFAATAALL